VRQGRRDAVWSTRALHCTCWLQEAGATRWRAGQAGRQAAHVQNRPRHALRPYTQPRPCLTQLSQDKVRPAQRTRTCQREVPSHAPAVHPLVECGNLAVSPYRRGRYHNAQLSPALLGLQQRARATSKAPPSADGAKRARGCCCCITRRQQVGVVRLLVIVVGNVLQQWRVQDVRYKAVEQSSTCAQPAVQ
jgi:hypothetical protein